MCRYAGVRRCRAICRPNGECRFRRCGSSRAAGSREMSGLPGLDSDASMHSLFPTERRGHRCRSGAHERAGPQGDGAEDVGLLRHPTLLLAPPGRSGLIPSVGRKVVCTSLPDPSAGSRADSQPSQRPADPLADRLYLLSLHIPSGRAARNHASRYSQRLQECGAAVMGCMAICRSQLPSGSRILRRE